MPREARLFTSSAGSAVRGYLKFRANIPPRWIKNARGSRKRIEPQISEGFRSLKRLRISRPRTRVAIRNAQRDLRSVLDRWETAYRKVHETSDDSVRAVGIAAACGCRKPWPSIRACNADELPR